MFFSIVVFRRYIIGLREVREFGVGRKFNLGVCVCIRLGGLRFFEVVVIFLVGFKFCLDWGLLVVFF